MMQGYKNALCVSLTPRAIFCSLLFHHAHSILQPALPDDDDCYHHVLSFAHDRLVRFGNRMRQQSDAVLVLLLCKDIRRSFTSTNKRRNTLSGARGIASFIFPVVTQTWTHVQRPVTSTSRENPAPSPSPIYGRGIFI